MNDDKVQLDGLFTITDLKQYIYCPRICFYHTCWADIRPTTAKMRHGIAAHETERKRAARRTMAQYHVPEGIRHFDVPVRSENLNLAGEIDEVVETEGGLFPVDYKLAKTAGFHFKVQLTAYALLLEEQTGTHIGQGFLYLMQSREMVTVRFTKKLRSTVTEALEAMQRITTDELMPPATPNRHRCSDCEFRRFCNDV